MSQSAPEVVTAGSTPPERDSRHCGAKKRQGEGYCKRPAGWGTPNAPDGSRPGTGPCKLHGGATPTVATGSARKAAVDQAERLLAGISEFAAVTDPVAELQRLAGRAVRWMEVLEAVVADLERIRYTTATGEQLDGRITVFERAMDRCGQILASLARLNLDERSVRVQEAQVAVLAGALRQALAERDMPDEDRSAIIVRVAELISEADQATAPPPRRLTA